MEPDSRPLVLVTGATSGIGAACAHRFAASDARLVLVGRRADRLDAVAASVAGAPGAPASVGPRDASREGAATVAKVTLDVRDRARVYEELARVQDALGAIDVLVNAAGLALGLERADAANPDDWDTMIDTNAKGLVHVTRALLPAMVARGRGHVINIGSVAGTYPYPGGNVYGATKAFVAQFSLNLRADLHGSGVRVTSIEPGMVETEFSLVRLSGDAEKARAVYRGMQPMTADDIADIVHFAWTRPAHVNVNRIEVMATAQAFAPFAVHRTG
jgi:NADP-dependent 3-hydroxy acid dehydrogenase YdfG